MYRSIQTLKEKKVSIKKVLNNTKFRIFLGFFILTFAVLGSLNMSAMSTKGYDIAELQKQITMLERENQRVELKIAEYSSMQSIQERLGKSDLVVADNIEYSILVGSTVARR